MKRLLALLALGIALVGCGGTGSSTLPNRSPESLSPSATSAPVSEAYKIQFLKDCGTKMNGWRTLDRATRNANLLAWGRKQPNIALGAILTACNEPYFQFTDGDAFVYENNKSSAGPVPPPSILNPKYADQPGKTRAFCAFSFRLGEFEDMTPTIQEMLNNRDYTTTRLISPTVSQVLAFNGCGVLFWQAHGGMCVDVINGVKYTRFCLDTGEVASDVKSAGDYAAYRNSHEVMLAGREIRRTDGSLAVIPEYAVSDLFIRRRLKFADNSLVCVDACTGGYPTMAQAFLAANAGTYVSWSDTAGPSSAHRFRMLFDRALGANSTSPVSHPDERPFDMDAVQKWMQDKGYDHDESTGFTAQLKFYKKAGYPSLMLRPTILRILYEGNDAAYNKTKLLLEGTFGPDPGGTLRSVKWGNTECGILSWTPYAIKIKFPNPIPVGPIQVIKEGRQSNLIPMTTWTLPVTYTLTGKGTLKFTVSMNLKLRADVRGTRFLPEDALMYYPVTVYTLDDSTGTMTASGSYKPDPNTTVTWSGTKEIKSYDAAYPANAFIFGGWFDLPSNLLRVTGMMDSATFTETETTSSGSTSFDLAASMDGYMTGFNIPYNASTATIAGGSLSKTLTNSFQYAVSAKVTWGAAAPSFPPTDTTGR